MRVLQFSLSVIFRRARRQNRHIHGTTRGHYSLMPPAPPLLQNSILGTAQHTRTRQFSPPPLPSSKTLHWVPYSLVYIGTSMYFGDGPWKTFVWCNLNSSLHLKTLPRTLLRRISKCTPWGIILTLHAISAPGAQLLTFTKYFCAGTTTYTATQYSADGGGA